MVRDDEQIMYVKLVIGKQKINIASAYAPHMPFSHTCVNAIICPYYKAMYVSTDA